MHKLKKWAGRIACRVWIFFVCLFVGHDTRIISRKLRVAHCRRCKRNDVWTAKLGREGHKHAP